MYYLVYIFHAYIGAECGYPNCLLIYVNTLYKMLAPLLNVKTCSKQDQLVSMTGDGASIAIGIVKEITLFPGSLKATYQTEIVFISMI